MREKDKLSVVIYAPWRADIAVIVALEGPGHRVWVHNDPNRPTDPDLFITPFAHGWHEDMFMEGEDRTGKPNGKYPYVNTAIAAAKKRRKGAR